MCTLWNPLRRFGSAAFFAVVLSSGWSTSAEADTLAAQQVLRIDFQLPDVPFPFGSPDTFVFGLPARNVAPIGSFTVSLFDRGALLGTFASSVNGELIGDFGAFAGFVSSTSTAVVSAPPFPPPTVIDFRSFVDRTIQGSIAVSIAKGMLDFGSPTLVLGQSNAGGGFSGSAFSDPVITRESISGVTPEPGTLILIGTGVAAVLSRRTRPKM